MIHKYNEIEIKLPADDVQEEDFVRWAYSKKPNKFLEVSGPDFYFKNGENIVRHRVPPNESSQLTVKGRKSQQSTRDRLEIDLTFGKDTTPEDVDAFLRESGFQLEFELHKRALIFWFKKGKLEWDASYYEVTKMVDQKPQITKKYIEIEICKGSEITPDTAKGNLKKINDELNEFLKTDLKPLNFSLYEIFQKEDDSAQK